MKQRLLKRSVLLSTLCLTLLSSAMLAQQDSSLSEPTQVGPKSGVGTTASNSGSETAKDCCPLPPPQSSAGSLRALPKDLISDQKAIWTSTLRAKRSDARWLLPFAAATAAMITTDRRTANELAHPTKDTLAVSHGVSQFGAIAPWGLAGGFYLVGRLSHNDRAQQTGFLGTEAAIDSSIVVSVLKLATDRERPTTRAGDGSFWAGGNSFPSGHVITSWSVAAAIADRYHDKPIVRLAAYGAATAISVSRLTGRNHFPSDVLVGSVLGYLIGHYVVHKHVTPSRPLSLFAVPRFD